MKEISRREAERMWRDGTPIEVDRRPRAMNTVLSIRMARELLRELEITARSQGKGPTTLARELIEQGLAAGPSASVPLLARVASRLADETARMASGRRTGSRTSKRSTTARRRAG